jgi:RNA polymerase sigma-70 factor (ECF subfamily)
MTQVADRNHAAFTEFFDRQAPVVLGVLVRLLRERWLAEEALQETFLQCWMQAGDYRREKGSPRAWLLMIARSRGLDRLRRERSRGRREEAVSFVERRVASPVGTTRLEAGERRRKVEGALSCLAGMLA